MNDDIKILIAELTRVKYFLIACIILVLLSTVLLLVGMVEVWDIVTVVINTPSGKF